MHPTSRTIDIITTLSREFPHFAAQLIRQNTHLSEAEKAAFIAAPDSPSQHAKSWHQFGIITHSQRFQACLHHVVPHHLEEWGIAEEISDALSEHIDDMTKGQLLHIAGLLHDTGKFNARGPDGFKGHEEYSGKNVRTTLKPLLEQQGLSDKQIEYIAACTELHYELGKLRRIAKKHDTYTLAFTKTLEFRRECKLIQRHQPNFALEIGLFFLADNLSKVEITAAGETDAALQSQKPQLEAMLRAKSLPAHLVTIALQIPISLRVAKEYLLLWSQVHNIRDLLWLKLTPESQQKLRKAFPPRYANHFGDHVTLSDDKPASELAHWVGKRATAEVYAHAINGNVEAVRIRTQGLPDSYGVPHITLSSAKGVHPFQSVSMLRGTHDETAIQPFTLEGVLELHRR